MTNLPPAVYVEVKSAWASKINWTQAIAMVAMLGTAFNLFELTPDMQATILSGIIAIQATVTWVLKTFFSPTVTPASVAASDKMVE